MKKARVVRYLWRYAVPISFLITWFHKHKYFPYHQLSLDAPSQSFEFISVKNSLHSMMNRGSRWQMFFKISVLKNFAIFAGKHLCWSLFLEKLQTWRSATLLKKTPIQMFSCEYCGIFKNTFFIEHFRWLLLNKEEWGGYKRFLSKIIFKVDLSTSKKLFYLLQWKLFKMDRKCFSFDP